jgi:hypothetical protein
MKPRLYLETTIPSYLVARRSRDLRLAADQETSQEWREAHREQFELFISPGAGLPRHLLPRRTDGTLSHA